MGTVHVWTHRLEWGGYICLTKQEGVTKSSINPSIRLDISLRACPVDSYHNYINFISNLFLHLFSLE